MSTDNPVKTGKCPVMHGTSHAPHTNRDWWPHQLDLKILHQQGQASNPMGESFDYAKEFKSLDFADEPVSDGGDGFDVTRVVRVVSEQTSQQSDAPLHARSQLQL